MTSGPRYGDVLALVRQAQELATRQGVPNVLLPGRLKEMALADILGHQLEVAKHGADARNADGAAVEYLTCLGRRAFAFDHLGLHNLYRITRNVSVLCAVFDPARPLDPLEIWHVDPPVLAAEARGRLEVTGRREMTFSVSYAWVRERGELVWLAEQTDAA